MRRHVTELQAFYATALGAAAQAMVARQIAAAWGDAAGLDVLGLGYAPPYLDAFRAASRRVVAAMPARQGAEAWPTASATRTCLVQEGRLPFPAALFDRVLMVHALEESEDPDHLLDEAARVLAASGRVLVAVTSRRGLWSHAEGTPFGHGRPFTRWQLEAAVRGAGLEPTAWARALYAPPHAAFTGRASTWERVGERLFAPLSGLIILEAVKQTFARPREARAAVLVRAFAGRPVAAGAPSTSSTTTRGFIRQKAAAL